MDSALPSLTVLKDCADFSKTVVPFIPQLYSLPQKLIDCGFDSERLKSLYLSTNPLISAFAIALFLAPVFLIVSEVNKNYSQVDRFWSILPTVYNAHFCAWAHLAGMRTLRMDTLLAFSAVWSLLLAAITFPSYILLLVTKLVGDGNTTPDVIFSRCLVSLVLVEWFADQQQWEFQEAKRLYKKTGKVPFKFDAEDLDRGFVVTGLWSWSRHPNFAAEQAIWVILYQWSCYVSDSLYNWTIVGAIGYLILFQASTWFTELITSGKYPEYEEYKARVGKFIPKRSTDLPAEVRSKEPAVADNPTPKATKKTPPS
ncbi:MAG: hypothetical protein M1825_006387 [Sarcosagium campestre]|nr:MAG: hypothetical protein M1825_006387 [Sarcosagium campestre]